MPPYTSSKTVDRARGPSVVDTFEFQDLTHQEVVKLINEEYPIDLCTCVDLIERVHARYPLLTQFQIQAIIKYVFQCMREIMILGGLVELEGIFSRLRLRFYSHVRFGIEYAAVRTAAVINDIFKQEVIKAWEQRDLKQSGEE